LSNQETNLEQRSTQRSRLLSLHSTNSRLTYPWLTRRATNTSCGGGNGDLEVGNRVELMLRHTASWSIMIWYLASCALRYPLINESAICLSLNYCTIENGRLHPKHPMELSRRLRRSRHADGRRICGKRIDWGGKHD
jgi:hypothetical protein